MKYKNQNNAIKENISNYTNSKGITLIALIITIIVLLILAAVSIAIALGPNGMLKKSEETAKLQKIQEIQEKLEVEKGPLAIDNKGKTTIENYLEHIVKEEIINTEAIEDIEESEKTKIITVEDKYVFLVEEEENGNIKITYEGEIGELVPKIEIEVINIATNEITIKVNTNNVGKGEYEYYIKDIELGEEYKLKEKSKENQYTFIGLTQNKEYQIKVIAKKIVTTIKESNIIRTIELDDLVKEDISFAYNPPGWSNSSITVTANANIDIPKGYRIQTSKDNKTWTDSLSQKFTEKGTVYARLFDGVNQAGIGVASVSKFDFDPPLPAIISILTPTVSFTGNARWEITVRDELSGIWFEKYSNSSTFFDFTTNPNVRTVHGSGVVSYRIAPIRIGGGAGLVRVLTIYMFGVLI